MHAHAGWLLSCSCAAQLFKTGATKNWSTKGTNKADHGVQVHGRRRCFCNQVLRSDTSGSRQVIRSWTHIQQSLVALSPSVRGASVSGMQSPSAHDRALRQWFQTYDSQHQVGVQQNWRRRTGLRGRCWGKVQCTERLQTHEAVFSIRVTTCRSTRMADLTELIHGTSQEVLPLHIDRA